MPKVVSGQKLRIAAADYNAMLDAANAYRSRQHDVSARSFPAGVASIIPMRNDAGSDLPAFSVLAAR